jgi:RNA polymerase sigma factor (sigma-70 family)
MIKLIELREQVKNSKDKALINKFKKHEALCIKKFSYLVTMKTGRYKAFNNYDDLNQEGFEALVKAMNNYNPQKGSFFWWAHKYIDTRISRSANLHTTIRYPLKVAKENTPHKETMMPLLVESRYCPDEQVEEYQNLKALTKVYSKLNTEQQSVIDLSFGINGDKPISINKICKQLNISRVNCIKKINSALSIMKDNIEI